MHCALYEFFRDQGGIIAGVLALIAGGLAYCIGRKQVAEMKRGNCFFQEREGRNLARMVVSATRILDGILKIVEDNIKTVDSFGTESWRTIDPGTLNPMRQKLEAPPRYEIIPQLGNLGREIIDNYFLLCVKIDDFRKPTAATNADSLHKEIDTIRKIVTGLREEIGQEGNKAHDRFAEERRQ